ncbi:MAG TPA: ABC transporter permease [Verrucomicrobiae bacterium]|nr:ABC transporter permease [Verrucomicrobiae bacterium]
MTDSVLDKSFPATETDSGTAAPHTTGVLLFRHRLVQAGGGIVIVLMLLALLAPALTRWHVLQEPILQNQNGLDTYGMPLAPGGRYLLGTDNLGRDVLSRVIYGARVSLTVGVAAMLTATVIGLTIGLLSGFYGGKLDMGLMRFTDMNLSIPSILLAIAFAGLMDGKIIHLHPAWMHWSFLDLHLKRGMVSVFLIVGFVSWPGMVRVIRGQVLSIKEREFVHASRALGASDVRVIFLHLLPNVLPTVIVLAAMTTANTIILEAGLDYLNVGVPPPAPTWGGMIDDGQDYFIFAPLIVIAPGVAILLTVLGFNLLGQGLQEVLNPHQTK